MENKSLLLFYFKQQRMRNVARRKSLARRRRRLYFILKRINENMRYLQFVQTITFAMLVMATIVSKINRRQYGRFHDRGCCGVFEILSKLSQISSVLKFCVLRGHTSERAWKVTC